MLWLLQALSGFAGPRATGQPRRSNVRSREAALNRQLPITRALTLLVKQLGDISDEDLAELLEGAAFQEAALAAGVPTPALRRTRGGRAQRRRQRVRVRLHAWVDLHDPDASLDPLEVGRLVAGLHRVEFAGTIGDDWRRALTRAS